MKYVVTISNLWVDGKKYRRGEVFESNETFPLSRVEPYVEPPQPVVKRRKRKTEDSVMEDLGFEQDTDS